MHENNDKYGPKDDKKDDEKEKIRETPNCGDPSYFIIYSSI